MAAIQLNFTLRTSGNVKTVHLLGSWDNYAGQLPLSKDASKAGGWKSTFRFPAATMKQGQRYWYYYILDGYHVSHDPARESVMEPTTRRQLNVLDIPASRTIAPPSTGARRDSRHLSLHVPHGRPLPASSIVSPTPVKPGQTRQIRAEQFAPATLNQLAAHFAAHRISINQDSGDDSDSGSDSDSDSDVPALSPTSSSRASSPTSSISSRSSGSSCSCERYGITRAGTRVKLDCRGARCGYSDDSSDGEGSGCYSEDDEKEAIAMRHRRATTVAKQQRAVWRQGMILRR